MILPKSNISTTFPFMAKKRSVTEMVAYVFVRNEAITPKRAQAEIKAAFGKEVKIQTVSRRLRELRADWREWDVTVTNPFRPVLRSTEPERATHWEKSAAMVILALTAIMVAVYIWNHV